VDSSSSASDDMVQIGVGGRGADEADDADSSSETGSEHSSSNLLANLRACADKLRVVLTQGCPANVDASGRVAPQVAALSNRPGAGCPPSDSRSDCSSGDSASAPFCSPSHAGLEMQQRAIGLPSAAQVLQVLAVARAASQPSILCTSCGRVGFFSPCWGCEDAALDEEDRMPALVPGVFADEAGAGIQDPCPPVGPTAAPPEAGSLPGRAIRELVACAVDRGDTFNGWRAKCLQAALMRLLRGKGMLCSSVQSALALACRNHASSGAGAGEQAPKT
jgi:hypothetical protein